MIYITSDPHFCHTRDFLYGPRGFNSADEMNEAIVERWNEVIKPEDDVYVLGDIMLNDNQRGIELLKSLKGKIHICIGNHDSGERIRLYKDCPNVVEVRDIIHLKYNGYTFYLSHYPTLTGNFDDGKPVNRIVWNLCGHSHTFDPFLHWGVGPIFHCEMDTNGCVPWKLDDIINLINKKWKEKNNG